MGRDVDKKWLSYIFCFILSGCSVLYPAPSKHTSTAPQETRMEKKGFPEERPHSREMASLHLTEQGQMLLERGKIDDAINVLERAVSIYGANGKNYYYLAEAWVKKGNLMQAKEWNRLAEVYLAEDREWSKRASEQRERIRSLIR